MESLFYYLCPRFSTGFVRGKNLSVWFFKFLEDEKEDMVCLCRGLVVRSWTFVLVLY